MSLLPSHLHSFSNSAHVLFRAHPAILNPVPDGMLAEAMLPIEAPPSVLAFK